VDFHLQDERALPDPPNVAVPDSNNDIVSVDILNYACRNRLNFSKDIRIVLKGFLSATRR